MMIFPHVKSELPTANELLRAYTMHVLNVCEGNRSHAARILGIDRKSLYRRMKAWGVLNGALSPEEVQWPLAEGREVRSEIEKRLDAMEHIDPRDAERKAR